MDFWTIISRVADCVTIACGIELAIALAARAIRHFRNHKN